MTVGPDVPLVFLAGPPGSGKTTLGAKACEVLSLRFADLPDDGGTMAALERMAGGPQADVVAIPWAPGRDAAWLRFCRKAGRLVALWAHPLDMQARSGRSAPLFTPSPRLTTRGGFGRTGTRCPEFRHLERACTCVVMLDGFTLDEATGIVARELDRVRESALCGEEPTSLERSLLWRIDAGGQPAACKAMGEAMARFLAHLEARGASPRTLSGIESDLECAWFLVLRYDDPKGAQALDAFRSGPGMHETHFGWKFSDSPRAVARFCSTWKAFSAFLNGCAGSRE